jgi:hypothetical protein
MFGIENRLLSVADAASQYVGLVTLPRTDVFFRRLDQMDFRTAYGTTHDATRYSLTAADQLPVLFHNANLPAHGGMPLRDLRRVVAASLPYCICTVVHAAATWRRSTPEHAPCGARPPSLV